MSTVVKKRVQEFPRPAEVGATSSRSQFFFNRELSLLEFHARVLEEALDDRNPLLERLKFSSIFSSNLDEFFMIRVSGLKEELQDANVMSADGLTPTEQLAKTRERILDLIKEQARCLREEILPQLKEAGIAEATVRAVPPSLEDVFIHLVTRAGHPDGGQPVHGA